MRETFTLSVKQEIIEADRTQEEAVLFLLALIIINGTPNSGKVHLRINDEELRTKTKKLIDKTFRINSKIKDKIISFSEEVLPNDFNYKIQNVELTTDEEYKTFITGLFFGKGYVSSPESKYYHLEIRVKELIEAVNIHELFNAIELSSNFQQKGKSFRIYIKKADHISDLLAAFKSPIFSMIYIEQKIQRDFKATISRQNAIDFRNQEKVAEASVKHQVACRTALSNLIKYKISKEEERIARLRNKYPEYSSQELAYEYSKEYYENKSKSTINR
jgi:DNA-binding protein WhiA